MVIEKTYKAIIAKKESELATLRAENERLRGALRQAGTDLFEAADKFFIASFYITDKGALACVESRVDWMRNAVLKTEEALR